MTGLDNSAEAALQGLDDLVSQGDLVTQPPLAGSGLAWTERYERSLMNTFGPPKRVLVRGEGVYVWDTEGKRYLDLLGGLAVNVLGHAHPMVIAAVTSQLATLGHVSNFFASKPQIALAERLLQIADCGAGAVFFTNSGTEANEAAFKLARRTGRPRIVAAQKSFHGRTMGALALTGKPAISEPFAPLPGGVEHIPYGDVAALQAAVDDTCAAVVLEPIQGEGGVNPAPDGYLSAARAITSEHGALLVLDEVQTGIGRTGAWFAFQHEGVRPDVVTVAKALGAGFPIGACLAFGPAAHVLGRGSHGSTFGGNPPAAMAGLAVLHTIERDGLLAQAAETGARLRGAILGLSHPEITEVRGRGLLLGIELANPIASQVTAAALAAGFIVNDVTETTIRLAPPLILTHEQAATFVSALPELLNSAAKTGDLP